MERFELNWISSKFLKKMISEVVIDIKKKECKKKY